MGVWRRTYNKRITVLDLNLGDLTKRFKQSLEIMPLRVVANIANKEFGKRHGARAREGGRSKSKRETREMVTRGGHVAEESASFLSSLLPLHSTPLSLHCSHVACWSLVVTGHTITCTTDIDCRQQWLRPVLISKYDGHTPNPTEQWRSIATLPSRKF
jgi:hypothetical protein